ncbi:TPA: hypothetical protein ACT5CM_005292, partial [Burkholderia cenocepacia]
MLSRSIARAFYQALVPDRHERACAGKLPERCAVRGAPFILHGKSMPFDSFPFGRHVAAVIVAATVSSAAFAHAHLA